MNVTKADTKAAAKMRAYKSAGLTFLALTSIFVTYPYAKGMAETISPFLAPFLGAVGAYLMYIFIDGPLSNALRYLEHSGNEKQLSRTGQTRIRWMLGLAVVTLCATGGMSIISNFLISNTVVPMPKAEQLGAEQKRNNLAWESGTKELTKAEQKAEQNIWKAKQEGHRLVLQAISLGDVWQQKSWKVQRFNWLEHKNNRDRKDKKYAVSIRQAMQDSAKTVLKAEQLRNKIAEQKAEHLGTITTVNSAIETAFLAEQNRAATVQSKFASFLVFSDVLAAIVVAFCSVWLRLFYKDGGYIPEAEHDFHGSFSGWQARKSDWIIGSLFGEKSGNNAKIAGRTISTAPAPAAPVEDVLALEQEKHNRQMLEMNERLRRIEEEKTEAIERAERETAEQKAVIAEQKKIEAEQKAQQKKKAEQTPFPKAEQKRSKPVSNRANRANKAEQNKTIVVQVVEQNGKPVIQHDGKHGTKFYTLSDVQSQKSTYAGRMKKADPGSKTYATNKRNYDIFCAYEDQLKNT